MILILLFTSLQAFAFDTVVVDYQLGDKHVVHTIDSKSLKIVSGASTVKRKLSKDDFKWIEEKIAALKPLAVKDCGEEAEIEIKPSGQPAFTVCGNQAVAQDFLSVLSSK